MRAVIVGGGIGGLATACALRRVGISDYVVLEQAQELQAIGAGIQITSNAGRVLRFLGLADAVARRAVQSLGTRYRDIASNEFLFESNASDRGEAMPYYQVHRAVLTDLLYREAGPEKVRLGERVSAVDLSSTEASVTTESGETYGGDVVIGADGIHSRIRSILGPVPEPQFSNSVGWRALIPREKVDQLGLDRRQHTWFGPRRSVIVYWIDGGERLNFLGIVPAEEVRAESWETAGRVNDLQKSYEGACVTVSEIVSQVDSAFITGIFDRPPARQLAVGRGVLVGDAGHPVRPHLAAGAGQALEDSVVLAKCIRRASSANDVPAALVDFEQRRLPRVIKVQMSSREWGKLSHLTDPQEIALRNAALRDGNSGTGTLSRRRWLWDYDPVQSADLPLDSDSRESVLGIA